MQHGDLVCFTYNTVDYPLDSCANRTLRFLPVLDGVRSAVEQDVARVSPTCPLKCYAIDCSSRKTFIYITTSLIMNRESSDSNRSHGQIIGITLVLAIGLFLLGSGIKYGARKYRKRVGQIMIP